MEKLVFADATFNSGTNLTVRVGDKWAYKVKPGDTVLLTDLENSFQREGQILGVYVSKFSDIPTSVLEAALEYEHVEYANTYNGLYAVLEKLYPDFSRESIVTLLFFK